MIKNSNLNEVFYSTVKMLLDGVWNGAQVLFSQNLDKETKFDIEFNIKKNAGSQNSYSVEFNDIDLIDPSNNADPAKFTVYTETRLFQVIDMLLEHSMLDGNAKCRIYDSDGDRVCEFCFVWESDI
jgi:hypothetical protein